MAADARLEHGLGDLDAQDVVLGGLDLSEVVHEHVEGTFDRRVNDDLHPDRGLLGVGTHRFSSLGCSTTAL
jgi:hypothetical protein